MLQSTVDLVQVVLTLGLWLMKQLYQKEGITENPSLTLKGSLEGAGSTFSYISSAKASHLALSRFKGNAVLLCAWTGRSLGGVYVHLYLSEDLKTLSNSMKFRLSSV